MDEQEVQDIQRRLNKLIHSQKPSNFGERQLEVVYWYCKLGPGDNELRLRQNIVFRMGENAHTLVHHQRAAIVRALEIDNIRYIPKEVCNVLVEQIEALPIRTANVRELVLDENGKEIERQQVLELPDFSKLVWPPPQVFAESASENEGIDQVLAEQAEETQETDAITRALNERAEREQSIQSTDPQPATEGSRRNLAWLVGLLPILLLLALVWIGINWFRGRDELPPDLQATVDFAVAQTVAAMSPVVETQIVEQPVEVPVTPEPDEIALLVQGTLETLPTQTPAIVTVLAPTIVVQTALATQLVPVTVEVTPAPTATPTETPLPQTVEIIEDFDDFTLDPAFTVEGEPQFIEGRMNVGDRVTISIGDETWKNYSVSFDVDSLGYGQSIQMTIRDNRTSKLRYVQDNPYWWSGGWQYLNNSGEFVTIIDSGVGWQPRVELVVEDNFLYHTSPDGATKTISNTYSDSGGFSLTLGRMWLDNLVVTRND